MIIDKKCTCGNKSTGNTTIRCCNLCGLPMPNEPWHFNLDENIFSQVEKPVMPNEVLAGGIKLMFGEDTEKYSLWCEIVNDVFMEYDTTSEGEDAQILIDKIERLLKLVSQREA